MVAVVVAMVVALGMVVTPMEVGDNNRVFQPCTDAKIQRGDGFTFGIAFSTRESFNHTQLSPCNRRLSLASGANTQLALFCPKVNEISLTINATSCQPPSL